MPSTYTGNLKLEKQATGENDNTWGGLLNTVLDMVDQAIAEDLSLSVAGSLDVTLSDTEYLNVYHAYSGILTGSINVIVPTEKNLFVAYNNTTGAFTLTVKTSAGTGIAIPQGEKVLLYCDGTNVIEPVDMIANVADDTTPQLGGPLDTNGQAIDHSEGAAVAAATQPDIFGGQDGNTIHITGATQIDDFIDAPRVGAMRWLIFDSTPQVTHGSGITVLGGASRTMAAGDMALVYADAVDAFQFLWFPSAGYTSGVASVPTGTVLPYVTSTPPTGYLMFNGESIGSAASGADQASADNEDLFTLFWDGMADAEAPVSSGRGANAAADWAANKTLTMPDPAGRSVIGSGTGAGLTARTIGDTDGEEDHILSATEMPSHTHSAGPTVPVGSGGGNTNVASGTGAYGASYATSSAGSDGAHNNMQPWLALPMIIKL